MTRKANFLKGNFVPVFVSSKYLYSSLNNATQLKLMVDVMDMVGLWLTSATESGIHVTRFTIMLGLRGLLSCMFLGLKCHRLCTNI